MMEKSSRNGRSHNYSGRNSHLRKNSVSWKWKPKIIDPGKHKSFLVVSYSFYSLKCLEITFCYSYLLWWMDWMDQAKVSSIKNLSEAGRTLVLISFASKSWLLNVSPFDIGARSLLGGCPVHCRIFSRQ